jgi:hypothetical protein
MNWKYGSIGTGMDEEVMFLQEVEVQRNAVYRNLTQMCACTVGTEAA